MNEPVGDSPWEEGSPPGESERLKAAAAACMWTRVLVGEDIAEVISERRV